MELMIAQQEGRHEFTDTITESERAMLRRALAARPHDRHPSRTDFGNLAVVLGVPFAAAGAPPNPPIGAVFGSAGAFESGSLPMPVETGAGGGTVVIGSLRKKATPEPVPDPESVVEEPEPLPEPLERSRRPPGALLALGTLALGTVVAFGVWFLTQGGTRPRPTGVAEGGITQPTPVGTVPTAREVQPKPPDPTKPPDAPIKSKSVFPAGTTPEASAKEYALADNQTAPDWVFVERNGERVRFRLITGQPGLAVAPVAIAESKVTKWQFSNGDNTPATGVTAADARAFARKVFGGDLPTADEWDHAAGVHDPRELIGPTLPTGRAWVDKPAPGLVPRETESDVNRFGLLDMAGNGREWTRTAIGPARDGTLGPRRDLGPTTRPPTARR